MLRTALGLSLTTGKPFCIENIRAGRKKPGLMRQHQTAVRAAMQISGASVQGDHLGSQRLEFTPGMVKPGEYHFAVGTAGSCILVLQAILPPLLMADAPSQLVLEGGTHNPYAPPFNFLADTYTPVLKRMGAHLSIRLERAGFYPAGGGRIWVAIDPVKQWTAPDICERGPIQSQKGQILLVKLPRHIGEREMKTVVKKLGWNPADISIREVESDGPGNLVALSVQSAALTETFTAFGQKGVSAERVAGRVCQQARRYLDSDACVGVYLSDQLLVPMALAGGGRFTTLKISEHFRTNVQTIKRFLDINIETTQQKTSLWEVHVSQ